MGHRQLFKGYTHSAVDHGCMELSHWLLNRMGYVVPKLRL